MMSESNANVIYETKLSEPQGGQPKWESYW